jgi:hypothetical protein
LAAIIVKSKKKLERSKKAYLKNKKQAEMKENKK